MTRTLSAARQDSCLADCLAGYGIDIGEIMGLDPQNAARPVPTERMVGGLPLREIRMVPYPYFPDVRDSGLAQDHPVTAAMNQLTLNWASPITIDGEKAGDLTVTPLVRSSPDSWTSEAPDLMPDYAAHPETGFASGEDRGAQTLAVAVSGRFTSAFAGTEIGRASGRERVWQYV